MTKLDVEKMELNKIDGLLFPTVNQNRYISYPDHHDQLVEIEESSFWFKHRNNCIVKLINKFSPHETLVDIGGGNGYVAKGIMDAGSDVILVEPGIKGAKNALKRGVNKVICAELQDVGFSNGQIPNIGLFDVLEHVENDVEFLRNLHRMLKDDGHLYLSVPAYQLLWSGEDEEAGHYRRYNLKSLTNVLKQTGFDVRFKSYMFFFLPLLILLFRVIPYKLKLKRAENKAENEHNPSGLTKLLDYILMLESKLLLSGIIRCGGSCLVVAKKK